MIGYECPYCGEEIEECGDDWEGCDLEDSTETACPECGKRFKVHREINFNHWIMEPDSCKMCPGSVCDWLDDWSCRIGGCKAVVE